MDLICFNFLMFDFDLNPLTRRTKQVQINNNRITEFTLNTKI